MANMHVKAPPGEPRPAPAWSPEEKYALVLEAASVSALDREGWLRSRGLDEGLLGRLREQVREAVVAGFAAEDAQRAAGDATHAAGGNATEVGEGDGGGSTADTVHAAQQIIDAIPVRVFWKDKALVYLGCNAAFARDAGFTEPKDMVGKDDYQLSWRAQADLYRSDDRQVIESGLAKLLIEEPQTTPEGETITLLTSKIPLRDASGEISGVLGTYMDITERKQVDESLRRSQALLEAMGHIAKVGGWALDLATQRLTWTSEVFRIHEVASDFEPTVEAALGFYAPESKPIIAAAVRRAIEQGEAFDLELWLDTAKGHRRWVHAVGKADTKEGRVVAVSGTFQDITERKQAEQALRVSEDRFRGIFSAVSDGIVLTDAETGRVALGNPALCELLGYAADELVGLDAAALSLRHTVRGAPDFAMDVPVRRKNGDILHADIHALRVEIGGKTYVLGCYRDVTERRQLQTQLAHADRLSTMGILAAGVAHEINNPLSFVLYNIESLSEDLPGLADAMGRCHAALCARIGDDAVSQLLGADRSAFTPAAFDDVTERFRDALTGTLRIRDIVRQLAGFSRVERTEVAPVDLHQAIEHAISMASNEIRYRARLVKDFGRLPLVLGSDGKLAQVFLNVLINAAHGIDEGHVERNEIRVRTWAEGPRVLVEVSDTGRGIAPEHRARLFEPFFTTKHAGAGTGLGLSICKSIVTGFGGAISFTSEPGEGTRFLIRLVASEGPRRDERLPAEAPVRPKIGGRILLVDDEAGVRRAVVHMVGSEHEVVVASSGEEGRAVLQADRSFDLVLCDLMMPDISGMDLHAWLSERDPSLAARVVFITGGAFTPGASDYLAKAGNRRLEKPFDTAAFKALIDELVLAGREKRAK